ncbi:Protein dj-1beta [Fragariocoptes setiger]|uniref:Protein dj-1beta n=1 Tax=Fragariocoptes setiger TaxID=1670756 RepID=A0ABQ7SBY6_9ACAR|nr:Protein dj-1beta [Fragariocoptes setiger]
MFISKNLINCLKIHTQATCFRLHSSSSPYLEVKTMAHKALLVIADGSEEMESTIPADVLRRGGIDVMIAGLKSAEPVKCSRGVKIVPDASLADVSSGNYDVVILPGGLAGAESFCASKEIGELLKKQETANKYIAAICAAPTAIKHHSIGVGKRLTSYPAMYERFNDGSNSHQYVHDQTTVVDGKLVTSKGPGTAFEFALKLVELLEGAEVADKVKQGLLLSDLPPKG